MGKASSGTMINSAILIALKGGIIKVCDVYGNTLFLIETNEEIVAISASPSTDDMFFGAITKSNKFLIYEIILERKLSAKPNHHVK